MIKRNQSEAVNRRTDNLMTKRKRTKGHTTINKTLLSTGLDCIYYATFNNISATSWRPVLVVEEAGVPGENHRPWASNW
jgi:hypothetical protein